MVMNDNKYKVSNYINHIGGLFNELIFFRKNAIIFLEKGNNGYE